MCRLSSQDTQIDFNLNAGRSNMIRLVYLNAL